MNTKENSRETGATALFPASKIARGAGLARQSVYSGLEGVAPAGTVMVDGKSATAWRYEDLPRDWRVEVTRRAVNHGFESGERFLASLAGLWKAPLPWSEIPEKQRAKAVKLQKAMDRTLAAWSEGVRGAELEQMGLEDYQREFGYALKDGRHWRRLLQRTIERDAGEENWQRLELFLPERALLRPKAPRAVARREYVHRELAAKVEDLQIDRKATTLDDCAYFGDAVFHYYEKQAGECTDSREGRRDRRLFRDSLIHYLSETFPDLASRAIGSELKKRFDEKLKKWQQQVRTP